ncbi:MAG: type II toxin-antitoxin system PemK/MazF family toxin [Trueperaceae bacterium]|nr:type II toxin-antitoxin system PemK/MazF family toxin [Trueperaceae bacterium]
MATPIGGRMPSCDVGDVVRLPFPYTDRSTFQHRPGLVVATFPDAGRHGLAWVLMITSARNEPWSGDVDVGPAYRSAGLPAPSVVRTRKITTVDLRDATRLGRVPGEVWSEVRRHVADAFG